MTEENENYECCGQTKMLIHTLFGFTIGIKCFVCHKLLWIHPIFDRKNKGGIKNDI